MSKNKTTRSSSNATTTSGGSAATLGNANTLWNLGLSDVQNGPQQYGGQFAAGLTPDQMSAFGLIRNSGSVGQGALNSGVDAATGAANFQPGQVNPALADSGLLGMIGQPQQASARDVSTSTLPQTDLTGYMNPFNNDVIQSSIRSIQDAQGQANAKLSGQQAASGAFGDSRSGVQAALQNQLFDRNTQSTVAGLNLENFRNAQGQAQTDLGRQLQAQQSNQGADVATSTANAGNSLTAMIQRAQNARGSSEFNANAINQGQQFNVNSDLAANAQRLGAGSTLGNLGMAQQQQVLNQANAQGAAGAAAQNTNQAGLTGAYQDYLNQQGMSQQQIQNLMSIFGATAPATGMTTTQRATGTQTTPQSLLPSLIGGAATVLSGPIGGALVGGAAKGVSGK